MRYSRRDWLAIGPAKHRRKPGRLPVISQEASLLNDGDNCSCDCHGDQDVDGSARMGKDQPTGRCLQPAHWSHGHEQQYVKKRKAAALVAPCSHVLVLGPRWTRLRVWRH